MAYEKRAYRNLTEVAGLVSFQVMVRETDLWISAESNLTDSALLHVKACRRLLEHYIRTDPSFLTSMKPVPVDPEAPALIREMAEAAARAGVGPMAAVAGAVAEFVGKSLLRESKEVIVENGGDLFLVSARDRILAVFAGASSFSHRLGIRVRAEETPLGVCTSSGTVGHSVSLGKSDAVTALSSSSALADAAATAAGNLVQGPKDIRKGLDFLASLSDVRGGLIIVGEKMGAWGEVELVKL